MSALNYNHLRYFWAVAHEGNLTRTAEKLAISQSALSTQIRTLEDRLGHALFERRGRTLHLTEAGRIALDHADRIFAAGDELVGTLRQEGRARQVLRVGALATLSRNFQIDFLRPVLGREDVEVVLHSGGVEDLYRALVSLALDIVLTHEPPARDGPTPLVTHRLAEQPVSLIGAPHRLAGDPEPEPDRLLKDHPVILPTRLSGIRTGFDAMVDRIGFQPQVAAEVDDMAMMRLLTREDIGLGVMPPIVVTDELASGLLAQSRPLPGISEVFYGVTVERRFPNPVLGPLLGGQAPRADHSGRAA